MRVVDLIFGVLLCRHWTPRGHVMHCTQWLHRLKNRQAESFNFCKFLTEETVGF